MDPNAILNSLRDWSDSMEPDEAQRAFNALDDWLSSGGFPPSAWT